MRASDYKNIANALQIRIDQHCKFDSMVTINKALAVALVDALRRMAEKEEIHDNA